MTSSDQLEVPVLVVEDQPGDRELLQRIFQGSAFRPIFAIDAEDALNKLTSAIRLAILDLVLPPDRRQPNVGLTLLRTIRMRMPALPIIVFSVWPAD
jgi:CheY-like chemotaxis protein